jgi:hypothetical protein
MTQSFRPPTRWVVKDHLYPLTNLPEFDILK